MSRLYHPVTIALLRQLSQKDSLPAADLKALAAAKLSAKDFYNYLFRLKQQDLASQTGDAVSITAEGRKLLSRLQPERDNIWKMVVFDIPEKHQKVRNVLRAKLKQLHFKKWQNSIWVSPYILDEEIEEELRQLGEKFFIRLIKFTEINHKKDLDEMFKA